MSMEDAFNTADLFNTGIENATDEERRKALRKEELSKIISIADEAQAQVNALFMQKLGYVPKQHHKAVYLPQSETKHDIGAPQYQARLDALLYIIRNPSIAGKTKCKSTAWSKVTNLSYIKYIFDYGIAPHHQQKIRHVLNDERVVHTSSRMSCASVISAVHKQYISDLVDSNDSLLVENELLRAISKFEFRIDRNNNSIVYKDFVLHYSTKHRAYHIQVGGKDIKIPLGAKDKFVNTFQLLDTLSGD